MAKSGCFSEADLRAFTLGELPEHLADTVARHLESCPDCEKQVSRLDDLSDPAIQALRGANRGRADPTLLAPDSGTLVVGLKQTVSTLSTPLSQTGFTILEELGRGGVGVVYRAQQHGPERVVALKCLLAGAYSRVEERARFLAEADAIARLSHPHIVQVYAVGEHEGQPFLCLEYLIGGNLAAKLGGRPQPPQEVARLVQLLARAVQHAHERGVVHRDLKPANILLAEDGTPKISDFGLARFSRPELTAAGAILGTPSYMAPEQACGDNAAVGPAADIWALGVILYECLTGQAPFRGVQALDTLELVAGREPVPPSRILPGVPRDLNVICLKCLEKSPAKRYASAADLAEDLERFLDGRPIRARLAGVVERAWRWCRRKPALATAALLACAGLLATVALSIGFALYQQQANADLRAQQKETQAALLRSRLLSAQVAKERGLGLLEQGDTCAGLTWLAYALEIAPAEAESLHAVLRTHLVQGSARVPPLRLMLAHPAAVNTLVFSPDGKYLFTGCDDGKVRHWDARTGKLLGTPLALTSGVTIGPSTDGKTLGAITSLQKPDWHYLDAVTGQPLRAKRGEFSPGLFVRGVPFMASTNGKTRVFFERTMLFNPRTKALVAGAPYTALVTTGVDPGKAQTSQIRIKSAWFFMPQTVSPDGRLILLLTLRDGLRVRSARTGAAVGPALPDADLIHRVVFSPNGQALLTADMHHIAQVRNVADGKPLSPPLRHPGAVTAVAFSPDGQTVLTGCADNTVRLWDLSPPKSPYRDVKGFDASYLAFTRDGAHVFAGSVGGSGVHLCEAATGKKLRTLPVKKGFNTLALNPAGTQVATVTSEGKADSPGNVALWDAATGKQLGQTIVHPNRVYYLEFSPDGETLATGCGDGKVRFWKTTNLERIGPVLEHPQAIGRLAFSPDGRTLLTACRDKQARLWDRQSGRLLVTLPHPHLIYAVAVNKAGTILLTGGHDRLARLWDAATGKQIGPALAHPQPIMEVAFSPDGHLAVTASSGKVQLWEAATGQPIGLPLFCRGTPRGLAFASDGRTVLVGTPDSLRLWDLKRGSTGAARELILSAQVLTGLEITPGGTLRALDGSAWQERRVRLGEQGGSVLP